MRRTRQDKTRQVLKVRELVLEPTNPGSILAREFLEGHYLNHNGRYKSEDSSKDNPQAYVGLRIPPDSLRSTWISTLKKKRSSDEHNGQLGVRYNRINRTILHRAIRP